MPTYKYEAVDSKGKMVKERIEAASSEEALERIREKRLHPTRVKKLRGRDETPARGKKKSKGKLDLDISIGGVKAKQINTFTRQLSTLQDAGIPIIQSLNILVSQTKKGLFRKIQNDMITDIQGGDTLSGAMSKQPKAFDKLYVSIINAGEVGGALDIILRRLADYREKIAKLKRKIISAMTYPVSVIFISLAIITGIMMKVIPQFSKMFAEMEIELPMITLALVRLSDFLVARWYVIFGIPVGIFILYKLIRRNTEIRFVIDKMKFKIPIMGNIINKSVISKFVRTLSTLVNSGVPILDALNSVKDITGNLAMTRAIESMHNSIREGESIANPLREANICELMVVNMIDIGEQSGELDKMLEKVADNYDDEIDTAVDGMVSMIEPLMIVFLGGAIGTIVIALFMPLIKMMDSLG